jgi:hypothetical protein
VQILDCTDLTVTLENARYEGSGITTKDKTPERGYKLGTRRSLLDTGAVLTGIAWGALSEHDLTLTRELLRTTPHLKAGDGLLHDRGFLDGADITYLKQARGVEGCTGLKSEMNLHQAAVVAANAAPEDWRRHPTRPLRRSS